MINLIYIVFFIFTYYILKNWKDSVLGDFENEKHGWFLVLIRIMFSLIFPITLFICLCVLVVKVSNKIVKGIDRFFTNKKPPKWL